MAYMEVSRVEVTEVIRRWQAGGSQRHISAAIGMSRSTVRKYITAAVQAGLRQDGAPPTEEQLTSLVRMNVSGPRTVEIPTEDTLAPWADQVYQWLTAERLQITRIQELLSARGCQVSYTSLRRFLQRRSWPVERGNRPGRKARIGRSQGRPGEVGDWVASVAWDWLIQELLEEEVTPSGKGEVGAQIRLGLRYLAIGTDTAEPWPEFHHDTAEAAASPRSRSSWRASCCRCSQQDQRLLS